LFGFLGIHAFYVKKPKQALFFILFSLCLIGGVGSLLFFFVLPGSIWAFLIPVFVQIMFQMIFAFHYLTSEDLKDGVGELMH
jgi:TM2 domain-containing membrane protein YozV